MTYLTQTQPEHVPDGQEYLITWTETRALAGVPMFSNSHIFKGTLAQVKVKLLELKEREDVITSIEVEPHGKWKAPDVQGHVCAQDGVEILPKHTLENCPTAHDWDLEEWRANETR